MEIWLVPVLVIIASLILVISLDTRSSRATSGSRNNIPSAIEGIMEVGPQCAQAVGVFKISADRNNPGDG
ncbi:MAG: hypothetical protein ACXABY_12190 [Candidatus Thorarchaeota archaeon]|jgi:hypothetical protein